MIRNFRNRRPRAEDEVTRSLLFGVYVPSLTELSGGLGGGERTPLLVDAVTRGGEGHRIGIPGTGEEVVVVPVAGALVVAEAGRQRVGLAGADLGEDLPPLLLAGDQREGEVVVGAVLAAEGAIAVVVRDEREAVVAVSVELDEVAAVGAPVPGAGADDVRVLLVVVIREQGVVHAQRVLVAVAVDVLEDQHLGVGLVLGARVAIVAVVAGALVAVVVDAVPADLLFEGADVGVAIVTVARSGDAVAVAVQALVDVAVAVLVDAIAGLGGAGEHARVGLVAVAVVGAEPVVVEVGVRAGLGLAGVAGVVAAAGVARVAGVAGVLGARVAALGVVAAGGGQLVVAGGGQGGAEEGDDQGRALHGRSSAPFRER